MNKKLRTLRILSTEMRRQQSAEEDSLFGCVSSLSSDESEDSPTVADGCDWYTMLQTTALERIKERGQEYKKKSGSLSHKGVEQSASTKQEQQKDPWISRRLAWSSPCVVGVVRSGFTVEGSDALLRVEGWERRYELSATCLSRDAYGMLGVPLCSALCPPPSSSSSSKDAATKTRVVMFTGGSGEEARDLLRALVGDAADRVSSSKKEGHPLVMTGLAISADGRTRETLPATGAGGGHAVERRAERLVEAAFRLTAGSHVVVTVEYRGSTVAVVQLRPGLEALCGVLRRSADSDDARDGVGRAEDALAASLLRITRSAPSKPVVACCISARDPQLAVLEWAHRHRVPASALRSVDEALFVAAADSASLDATKAKMSPPTVADLVTRSPPKTPKKTWPPPTPNYSASRGGGGGDVVMTPSDAEEDQESPPPSSPSSSEEQPATSAKKTRKATPPPSPAVFELVSADRADAVEELESVLAETKATRTRALREALESAREARAERDALSRSAREAEDAARIEADMRVRAFQESEMEARAEARRAAAREVAKLEARADDAEMRALTASTMANTVSERLAAAEAVAAAALATAPETAHALTELERRSAQLEAEAEEARLKAEAERAARLEARKEADEERRNARNAVHAITANATQQLEETLRDVRASVSSQADAARNALRQLADERDIAVRDSQALSDRLRTARSDAHALRRDLARTKARLVAIEAEAKQVEEAPLPLPPPPAAVAPPPAPPLLSSAAPTMSTVSPVPHTESTAEERPQRIEDESELRRQLRDRERDLDELRASSRREAAALWLAVGRAEDALQLSGKIEETPVVVDKEELLESSLTTELDGLNAKLAAVRKPKKKKKVPPAVVETSPPPPPVRRPRVPSLRTPPARGLGSRQTVERVERTNRDVLDFLELSSSSPPHQQSRRHVLSPSRILDDSDSRFDDEEDYFAPPPPPPPPAPYSSAKSVQRGRTPTRRRSAHTPSMTTFHNFPNTLRSSPSSKKPTTARRFVT